MNRRDAIPKAWNNLLLKVNESPVLISARGVAIDTMFANPIKLYEIKQGDTASPLLTEKQLLEYLTKSVESENEHEPLS